jgi:hypothetical protein
MNTYARKFAHNEFAAFRRASGEELGRLCVSLASWKDWPKDAELYRPSEETAECTRAELARAKELLASSSPLDPQRLATDKIHQDIRELVPNLNDSMSDVTIASLRHDPTVHGGYFLSLVLDDKTSKALSAERNRFWQAMELIAGVPVGSSGWKSYRPDIRLAYIPPGAMEQDKLESLCAVIDGTVQSLPVSLRAAELPIM